MRACHPLESSRRYAFLRAVMVQEAGKENLFTFGVDAQDVDRLRKERKDFKDYDPRWKEAFKLIYDGKIGDKAYFKVMLLLGLPFSAGLGPLLILPEIGRAHV